MGFPHHAKKHQKRALFSAIDFMKSKGGNQNDFPHKYILIYQSSLSSYIKRHFSKRLKVVAFRASEKIYLIDHIGIVKISGIGAPNTIVVLEELIALGGHTFISVGYAGGLQKHGVYICDKSIRDEGTSHHYLSTTKYSFADKNLTQKISRCLTEDSISYRKASGWTIDAPYRETLEEIGKYRREGVATVDMEASALFAVGKMKGVKVAAIFVVADLLREKWIPISNPGKSEILLRKVFLSVLHCLKDLA